MDRHVAGDGDRASKKKPAGVLMPGFEYLQRAYALKRGRHLVLVPTQCLTPAEFEALLAKFDASLSDRWTHARELRQWRRSVSTTLDDKR
jgi:hypothetical protein